MTFVIDPYRQVASAADLPVLTGLSLHVKIDSLSGTADAAQISSWTDHSPGGYHMTASGTERPYYSTTAGPSGGPCLRFLGGQSLSNAATPGVYHVFAVARGRGAADTGLVWQNNGGLFSSGFDNATDKQVLACAGADAKWIAGAGFALDYYLNGVSYPSSNMAFPMNAWHVLSISRAASWWAAGLLIGRERAGQYIVADLAELIVYSGVLSTPDRDAVESYLGTKYGISVA